VLRRTCHEEDCWRPRGGRRRKCLAAYQAQLLMTAPPPPCRQSSPGGVVPGKAPGGQDVAGKPRMGAIVGSLLFRWQAVYGMIEDIVP
jgi:hypothetical protein